jgi:transcriptional regulator with XRE-family HTH domain
METKVQNPALEIGKRLKEARKTLKIKQKDMADKLQIQASYLCAIENGNINPGPEFFIRFASIYKINLNYLFLGAKDMFLDVEGKVKKEEIDLDEEVDSIEKIIYFLENSVHVRALLTMTLNRALYSDKDLIKKDIEKKKAKEKEDQEE